MKRFYGDNALELLALRNDLEKLGVEFTTSSAYTPSSNGIAKRMNRKLLDKARAMLVEARMSERFRNEATMHAAYRHRRTVTPTLGLTSQEALLGIPPNNGKLRIFGSAAYTFRHKENRVSKSDK